MIDVLILLYVLRRISQIKIHLLSRMISCAKTPSSSAKCLKGTSETECREAISVMALLIAISPSLFQVEDLDGATLSSASSSLMPWTPSMVPLPGGVFVILSSFLSFCKYIEPVLTEKWYFSCSPSWSHAHLKNPFHGSILGYIRAVLDLGIIKMFQSSLVPATFRPDLYSWMMLRRFVTDSGSIMNTRAENVFRKQDSPTMAIRCESHTVSCWKWDTSHSPALYKTESNLHRLPCRTVSVDGDLSIRSQQQSNCFVKVVSLPQRQETV